MASRAKEKSGRKGQVLILVASDSDIPALRDGLDFLREMGVAYTLDIVSAHRHPEKAASLAKGARAGGFDVIIAGAGLAAALPGVVAAHTTLPVIGIPFNGGSLLGLDALLSIVQMPKGVPVATVGIGAARNACILACEILSIKHDGLRQKLEAMKDGMRREIDRKSRKLRN